MSAVSGLEIIGAANILPWGVFVGGGLVYNIELVALVWHGAEMLDRYLAVASGWSRSRLLLAEEFSVVALYDWLQVCCAAIRDLQGVTVENFVELVVWGGNVCPRVQGIFSLC